MRVIAGTARHLPLKTVEGMETRPTTDRIKETLFNMIQNQIPGCRFLDLFSGSGAIGIEALSRGAAEAVLIENQKKAITCIRDNLEFTRLKDRAVVMECDVMDGIGRLEAKKQVFDFIFMDPPYHHQWEKQVLAELSRRGLADENTIVIVEASLETEFSYVEEMGFEIIKQKRYKTNQHVFLRREEKNDDSDLSGKF